MWGRICCLVERSLRDISSEFLKSWIFLPCDIICRAIFSLLTDLFTILRLCDIGILVIR